MSVNALSGHGTLIAVQLTPGGAFTNIAEQQDITMPGLMRNEFDATTQNENIDSYVLGVMRRDAFTLSVNFIPSNNTHDHLTGVQYLMINNTMTGWKATYPDGTALIFSGQVQAFKPTAPVDGKLSADITIRFSSLMKIGTVTVGS